MFRNQLPDVLTTCVGALHNVQGTHDFIEDEEEWEKQIMERLRRLTMNLQSPNPVPPVPPEVLKVPVPEGNFVQKFAQKRKANQVVKDLTGDLTKECRKCLSEIKEKKEELEMLLDSIEFCKHCPSVVQHTLND